MKPFVHLHTHSHYSLLDGLGKIDKILDRAQELGMTAMALTDHANIYGAVEWCVMAKDRGIKPIVGCEMYVCDDMHSHGESPNDKFRYHLVLLVENEIGYKNLLKLITLSHLEGFHIKPRIDKKALKKYHEGLIALSGCKKGEIPAALIAHDEKKGISLAKQYKKIFGDSNFFLELQSHPKDPLQQTINDGLLKISKEIDIPVVATEDIHYIHPQDASAQDILLCIQTNRKVYEKDRKNFNDLNLSLRSPEEMYEAFSSLPEALENTVKIAERCNFQIKLGETELPTYPLPSGETADSFLRDLTLKGLHKRFKDDEIQKEHLDRMEYELNVIQKTGYSAYFLIVQDFINWAKNQGIVVGPGRGSAAGSFVSYLTGITNIDPIKYNLLFERFLNPERVSMPDVDVDFADDRRDDVLNYCREKYGKDHVAHIITFGTMAARAAIRDAGRALGLPYDFCDKTAKFIPMFSDMKKALEDVPDFKRLYDTNAEARKLIDSAKRLEGVCRHASVHACGIVITPKAVSEYTPLQQVAGHDEYVTQYSSSTKTSYVEKIGLLKMDFLGLKNLTIIQNTLKIIKKIHNIDIDMDTISLDDPKAYKLLQEGRTTGVFQLESSGMKRYLKLLKPTVFEDIIAMVALYRPGPMEWIPDFIDGKHGKKKIEYIHPKLEPILKDTYGVAVYQEQVMRIARDLAGFSMGEADVLRKAMGKKILELIQEQKEKFAKRCVENGISEEIARKVFAFIEPFAGYGFNRSHAACYGFIGYQTAYLKAHYPAEFMAALMTSDQDNSDRIAIEAAECRGMGIEVLPPDINESFEEFAVIIHDGQKKPFIRFGLNAIKNVGKPVAKEIVFERKRNGKFSSLTEFLERVHTKDLNKKSIEALAKVGALESIAERNLILGNIETILAFSKAKTREKESNQSLLFSGNSFEAPSIHLRNVDEATRFQKLRWERELLGLYVSDHPTSEYKEYLDMMCPPIHRLNLNDNERSVRIGGVIQAVKEIHLKDKKTMAFVTLENTTGSIEALVFPKTYKKTKETWSKGSLVIVDGKISTKDGECKLITNSVASLGRDALEMINRIKATKERYSQDVKNNSIKNTETVSLKKESEKTRKSIIEEKDNTLTLVIPPNTTKKQLEELSLYLKQCPSGEKQVFITIQGKLIKTSLSLLLENEHRKNIESILFL